MHNKIDISNLMLRLACLLFFGLILISRAFAQSPKPAASPSPTASAPIKPSPPSSATPMPSVSPTTEELINSLTSADVQTAISLLKNHFTNPEAITEVQLNRATLEGLIVRLSNGLLLLPRKESSPAEPPAPFYSELLEGHIAYVRPGTFSTANLQMMDKKFAELGAKKADALVLDLRASSSSDFAVAAEFAKRFVPKGKMLFSLRKQGKQDRTFSSDHDQSYNGLLVLLADADTTAGAEAVAAALRFYMKALVIGQPTAGRAVEYSDLPLPSGKILRVAVSECIGPDGHALYPEGIKPDLPVEMSAVDKRQIFQLSANKGMGPFIHEIERPHLNEAALIAGTNPELESADTRRSRAQANALRDSMLQRAIDLVTSLEIVQKR